MIGMERRKILASFIKALEESGVFKFDVNNFEDRLKLQKYVYLFSKLFEDLGYEFTLYVRGPYSRELADDYYSLNKEDIKRADPMELPLEYISFIKGKDSYWLEIAATYLSFRLGNPNKSLDDLCNLITEIKPWTKHGDVKNIASEVENFLRRIKHS